MAHIETTPLSDLISMLLQDRETALYFIMEAFEEIEEPSEIADAVEQAASSLGLKRISQCNLKAKIAEVQKLPKSKRTLDVMADVLEEAGYE